jgi:hypothetical protein
MRGGTPGTNPRQQPPSAWQVSRCWVIWIFLVCDEFAEYPILGTKYSGMKLLGVFSIKSFREFNLEVYSLKSSNVDF